MKKVTKIVLFLCLIIILAVSYFPLHHSKVRLLDIGDSFTLPNNLHFEVQGTTDYREGKEKYFVMFVKIKNEGKQEINLQESYEYFQSSQIVNN